MATPPPPDVLALYTAAFNESAPFKALGLQLSFPNAEEVQLDLTVRAEHRGGLGTDAVNGGVLAAMFDFAIGCTPALIDPTRRTATLQLSMSFERPVRGDRVRSLSRSQTTTEKYGASTTSGGSSASGTPVRSTGGGHGYSSA